MGSDVTFLQHNVRGFQVQSRLRMGGQIQGGPVRAGCCNTGSTCYPQASPETEQCGAFPNCATRHYCPFPRRSLFTGSPGPLDFRGVELVMEHNLTICTLPAD